MNSVLQIPSSTLDPSFPIVVSRALHEMQNYPYENLSKIHRAHHHHLHSERPRDEEIFVTDAIEKGTGGTCYALTFHLYMQLKRLGYSSSFVMGDKSYQKNIHCALVFSWNQNMYLLDPGYMIYHPLKLPQSNNSLSYLIDPNDITLRHNLEQKVWELCTGHSKTINVRFLLRQEMVGEQDFFHFWRESFSLPMMGYPVLNCLKNGVQYYLQKQMLVTRSRQGSQKKQLSHTEMLEVIPRIFGLDHNLTEETLGFLSLKNTAN